MKRKLLYCFMSVLILVAVIFFVYIFTTKSPTQCLDYCVDNSAKDATNFVTVENDYNVDKFVYYIAVDGDQDAAQEIFVFKKIKLWFIDLNRYKIEYPIDEPISGEYSNKIGVLNYSFSGYTHPWANYSTLILYGSLRSSNPVRCTYTVDLDGGTAECESEITTEGGIWILEINEIYDQPGHKKQPSNFCLYDDDGTLLGTYN